MMISYVATASMGHRKCDPNSLVLWEQESKFSGAARSYPHPVSSLCHDLCDYHRDHACSHIPVPR